MCIRVGLCGTGMDFLTEEWLIPSKNPCRCHLDLLVVASVVMFMNKARLT